MFSFLRVTLLPISENLSVILLSLSKSFSISTVILLSTFFSLSIVVQPNKEDKGVAIWCAVSLAKEAQILFLFELIKDL